MRDGYLADVVTRAAAVCGTLPDQVRWNVPYFMRAGARIAPDQLSDFAVRLYEILSVKNDPTDTFSHGGAWVEICKGISRLRVCLMLYPDYISA